MHALTTAALVIITVVAALVAVGGVVLPAWRSQPRNVYYSTSKVVTLIAVFAASAAGLFVAGESLLGWVAVAFGGWLVLEGSWAMVKSRTSVFDEPELDEAVDEAPAPVVAQATEPAVRRANPTPRGPVNQRRRR